MCFDSKCVTVNITINYTTLFFLEVIRASALITDSNERGCPSEGKGTEKVLVHVAVAGQLHNCLVR